MHFPSLYCGLYVPSIPSVTLTNGKLHRIMNQILLLLLLLLLIIIIIIMAGVKIHYFI